MSVFGRITLYKWSGRIALYKWSVNQYFTSSAINIWSLLLRTPSCWCVMFMALHTHTHACIHTHTHAHTQVCVNNTLQHTHACLHIHTTHNVVDDENLQWSKCYPIFLFCEIQGKLQSDKCRSKCVYWVPVTVIPAKANFSHYILLLTCWYARKQIPYWVKQVHFCLTLTITPEGSGGLFNADANATPVSYNHHESSNHHHLYTVTTIIVCI